MTYILKVPGLIFKSFFSKLFALKNVKNTAENSASIGSIGRFNCSTWSSAVLSLNVRISSSSGPSSKALLSSSFSCLCSSLYVCPGASSSSDSTTRLRRCQVRIQIYGHLALSFHHAVQKKNRHKTLFSDASSFYHWCQTDMRQRFKTTFQINVKKINFQI